MNKEVILKDLGLKDLQRKFGIITSQLLKLLLMQKSK